MRILNRFTGEVIFECKCKTLKECVINAVRDGSDLREADLSGADLREVNLTGVNLSGVNLRNANFKDANLWDEKIIKNPICINAGLKWQVWITDRRIKIGCQIHSTKAWKKFTDEQIEKMSEDALDFWKVWKNPILAMAKAHQEGIK